MPSYHCFEPPITIPPRFVLTQEPPGSDWLRAGISPRLIMVHTLIHTSAMQLHSLFAHIDRDEREECMRSANEIARIAAEVADLDPFMLPNTVAVRFPTFLAYTVSLNRIYILFHSLHGWEHSV
jgi:hypothetical protein